MTPDKNRKINVVEYYMMKEMLENILCKELISQEEMNQTIERIYRENSLADKLYGNCKQDRQPIKIIKNRKSKSIKGKKDNTCPAETEGEYVFLTMIARSYNEGNPSYIIQSWLQDKNTLAILNLWENNPSYDGNAYLSFWKKNLSFIVTVKQWIEETKAIRIIIKQSKGNGTLDHPLIYCRFATWISLAFKMVILKKYHLTGEVEMLKFLKMIYCFMSRVFCLKLSENTENLYLKQK